MTAFAPARPPFVLLVTLLLAGLLLMVLLAWPVPLQAQTADAAAVTGTQELTQAQAVASDGDSYPADAPATTVSLPDDWSRSFPHRSGTVWYRLRFDSPSTGGAASDAGGRPLQAAWIERACSNLEVRLNGRLIHAAGRMTEPVSRNCYYAQLMVLPEGLLKPAGNELDIKVAGSALERVSARQRAGGLSVVRVGAQAELLSAHESHRLWTINMTQTTTAVLALLGLGALLVARMRRTSYLAYFGLTSLLWSVLTLRLWWRNPPLPSAWVEALSCALMPLVVACAILFLLRYSGVRERWIETFLWLQCLAVPAGLALAGPERLFQASSPWYTILAIEFAGVVVAFLMREWQRARTDFWLMGGVLAVIVVMAALDVATQQGLPMMPGMHLLQLAMPLLFVVIGLRIFQLFGETLSDAENARASLEHRVADVTEQLARNYTALAEQRAEEVAAQERKRIAADLHDDLGAKLLTIVHTSDNERISALAREALEEMRLSVRGIAGKPVNLADAAADWRSEAMSRLSQGGIELNWDAPNEADLGERKLSARAYVQTTRILREAVSNMIKHSGASQCNVKVAVAPPDFEMTIADNGRGVPIQLDGMLDRGHGMSSMKRRAKQMQGQCLVESGPGYGTVIRLTLPL